ncbi:FAD:protein FMN transferase [Neobacillus sp. 3P2-tot-E-2]|uniref:FAD:protein FMN transferase n=1 Tax=Neobacillus sp. 3P2-tot-E-2 TaxID=3132212 RepID=UPI0039A2B673
MNRTEFRAMNCTIKLDGMDREVQLEIKQMIREFEQTTSRFIPDNYLSYLNSRAQNVPILLDDTFANLLDQSLTLTRKTDYYVHPFMGDYMREIGYTSSFHENYEPIFEEGEFAIKEFREEPIERLSEKWLIKKRDFSFDFGGFGKGYIIDQVKKQLLQKRSNNALINAGGDLTVIGSYEVGIEHPILMGKDMMRFVIKDCALATSGKNYRKWEKDQSSYHHILNGRTGEPAQNGVLQASVIADNVMEAETAAKLFCILPFEEAKALLSVRFPKIAYFIYFENNQIAIGGDKGLYERLEVAQ